MSAISTAQYGWTRYATSPWIQKWGNQEWVPSNGSTYDGIVVALGQQIEYQGLTYSHNWNLQVNDVLTPPADEIPPFYGTYEWFRNDAPWSSPYSMLPAEQHTYTQPYSWTVVVPASSVPAGYAYMWRINYEYVATPVLDNGVPIGYSAGGIEYMLFSADGYVGLYSRFAYHEKNHIVATKIQPYFSGEPSEPGGF